MLKPLKSEAPARYVLNGVSTKQYVKTSTPLTILVTQANANPGYQSEEIIYVNKPYQINNFGKNVWVAAPSQLLLSLIVDSLRNSNFFHAVVSPPFTGSTDVRLESQLITLQQEFFARKSQVRLVMQLTLVNNNDNKIIASQRFSTVAVSATLDPYGGVVAANKATQSLMPQITEFVIHTLTSALR